MAKPYVLLWDPSSGRAAVYDHGHRLMHALASPALVAFARARAAQAQPWDDDADAHFGRERAPWMPAGSLQGWVLYWLRDARSTAQHLRETPDR